MSLYLADGLAERLQARLRQARQGFQRIEWSVTFNYHRSGDIAMQDSLQRIVSAPKTGEEPTAESIPNASRIDQWR